MMNIPAYTPVSLSSGLSLSELFKSLSRINVANFLTLCPFVWLALSNFSRRKRFSISNFSCFKLIISSRWRSVSLRRARRLIYWNTFSSVDVWLTRRFVYWSIDRCIKTLRFRFYRPSPRTETMYLTRIEWSKTARLSPSAKNRFLAIFLPSHQIRFVLECTNEEFRWKYVQWYRFPRAFDQEPSRVSSDWEYLDRPMPNEARSDRENWYHESSAVGNCSTLESNDQLDKGQPWATRLARVFDILSWRVSLKLLRNSMIINALANASIDRRLLSTVVKTNSG